MVDNASQRLIVEPEAVPELVSQVVEERVSHDESNDINESDDDVAAANTRVSALIMVFI